MNTTNIKNTKDGRDSESTLLPRVMIAGVSSCCGKTTITCGLLELLKDRGSSPISFKCGPDYIDPMFHRTVLNIESNNLDTYLAGHEGVRHILSEAAYANGSGCAVIEGVMGIYDGMTPGSLEGSCYEIAEITKTPIILVVNGAGIGGTIASVITGILAGDRSRLIKGIIINRMSSTFFERLRPHLETQISGIGRNVAVLGHVPPTDDISVAGRHLGLVTPDEIEDIRDKICRSAKIIETGCDIEELVNIMSEAPDLSYEPGSGSDKKAEEKKAEGQKATKSDQRSILKDQLARQIGNKTIAVARDEAFCFYYPENLKLFERLGAKIVYFSPIHDEKIPDGTDALMFGGGYSELWLSELCANTSMLRSVRTALAEGTPSIAECGGFMYLHRSIKDMEGREFEMVGAIDGSCRYTGHLVNFGYTQIMSTNDDLPDEASRTLTGIRGHEFHYYESSAEGTDATLCKPSTGRQYTGMYISSDRLWGWPHLYYPQE